MKKYTFRVYTTYDPEDGFNAWTRANNEFEARQNIQCEYHSITRIELMNVK